MKLVIRNWVFKFVSLAFMTALSGVCNHSLAQERVLGLDISAWQGNISQTTWNNIHNVENRDFIILRSSRGGTTGYYNQSNAGNNNPVGQNTFSQRYDDPYFVQNMSRVTATGMFAGSYHFSRPDIIATTLNSGGIANSGTDEADHFIQMAGAFMRPGYLLPVHDFEAGDGLRTDNEMAQFCIDFSNRIYEVMGIRPAIYTSGNYAGILGGATASLRAQVVAAYPTLWSARWPNQLDPDSIDVQNGQPKDSYTPIYGPWDDYGTTHPWTFWQYASTGRLQSFNNGGSNLDLDVGHGDTEWLKDFLVPAIWTNDNSGEWTAFDSNPGGPNYTGNYPNWNSGLKPVKPVPGAGQVTPVGDIDAMLPAMRLPGGNDTVILDRPTANITVTLSGGTQSIRKLFVREALNITGGSLSVNYDPTYRSDTSTPNSQLLVHHSGPISAQFSEAVSLTGTGNFSVHTLQVDATRTFTLGGGTLTFNKINLMPHSTTPAKIGVTGNVNINPLSNATATISNGTGAGTSGLIDLNGASRTFTVGNGSAAVDLSVDVPITNGGLTKAGAGTVRLTGANTYSGGTTISAGTLLANNTTGSGVGSGAVIVNGGTFGGTGSISSSVEVNSGGRVGPGASAGLLTVGGGVTFNSGSFFDVELGGLTAGTQYDQLAVGGTATLGGTLNVSLLPGFTPTMGNSITVLTAPNISGTFANVVGPTVGGSPWQVAYNSNSVVLSLGEPLPPPPPPPPSPGNVIDDFEVNEGHFGWSYNASPVSQTFGLSASTTIDRVTTESQSGIGSQQLSLVSDGSATWGLRHNSGIGTVAHPAGNTPLAPTGWVGFWLKTDESGISVQLGIDDPTTTSGTGSTALEKGIVLNVVGDNAWHLYQWNLEDAAHWNAFAGGADGDIDAMFGTVSIDSIFFAGAGNAQIYLDNVMHNPLGMLAEEGLRGDYNGNGVVDAADYSQWRATFGQTVTLSHGADGNGNGTINAADYVFWRDRLGIHTGSDSGEGFQAAVPEPASWVLLLGAMCLAVAYGRHR